MNSGLYDLVMSGHTAIGTIMMLCTAHVMHQHPGVVALAYIVAAGNSALQIVVGDHWTSDVLISNYVVIPTVWLLLSSEGCYSGDYI
jgi:hypothetical protein